MARLCTSAYLLLLSLLCATVVSTSAREVEIHDAETLEEYLCPTDETLLPNTKLVIFESELHLNIEKSFCLIENTTDISIVPSEELENNKQNLISVTCNGTMFGFFNVTNLTIRSVTFINCTSLTPFQAVRYIDGPVLRYSNDYLVISLIFNHCNDLVLFNVLIVPLTLVTDFAIIGTNLCGHSNITAVMPNVTSSDFNMMIHYVDTELTTSDSKCSLYIESNLFTLKTIERPPTSIGPDIEYYLYNIKPSSFPVMMINEFNFGLCMTQGEFNVNVSINILPFYQDKDIENSLASVGVIILFINSVTQSKVQFRGYPETICNDKSNAPVSMLLDVIFYETPNCVICSNDTIATSSPLLIHNSTLISSSDDEFWPLVNSILRIVHFPGYLSHRVVMDNVTWCECQIETQKSDVLLYFLSVEGLDYDIPKSGDLHVEISNMFIVNSSYYYMHGLDSSVESLLYFSKITNVTMIGTNYFDNIYGFSESIALIGISFSNFTITGNVTMINDQHYGFSGGCLKLDNSSNLLLMEPLNATFSNRRKFQPNLGDIINVPIRDEGISGIQLLPDKFYSTENVTNIDISLYFSGTNSSSAKLTSLYAPQFSFVGKQLSDKFLFNATTWDTEHHQYAYTTLIDTILKNISMLDKYNSLSNGICIQLHTDQSLWTCKYIDETDHNGAGLESTQTYPGGVALSLMDSLGKKSFDAIYYSYVSLSCLHTTWTRKNETTLVVQSYFCNESLYEETPFLSILFSNPDARISSLPIIKVSLNPKCPQGFVMKDNDCACYCDCWETLKGHRYNCDLDTFSIISPPDTWTGMSKKGNGSYSILVGNNCPPKYCNLSLTKVFLDSSLSDSSCLGNHTGILCGECKENYSVVFGSDTCYSHCTDVYLLTLPVYALAGLLLVFILFVFRVTVATGTINGVIFYANMLGLVMDYLTASSSYYIAFLRVFISLLNLDLGFPLCLYEGMTTAGKVGFQFVFPVYLWSIVIAMILISKCSPRFSKTVFKSSVQVLATLFYLSFSKILSTVITVISFSKQYTLNSSPASENSHTVWYYNGAMTYGHGVHGLLLVIAIAFTLLFLLPYALLVTFAFCFARFGVVNKFKPFIDAYGGPFKDRWKFWFGLRLWVTIFLFLMEGILQGTNKVFLIHIVVIWVFILLQGLLRPFESTIISLVDIFFMLNYWLIIDLYLLQISHFLESYFFLVTTAIFVLILIFVYHGVILKYPKIKLPSVKRFRDYDDLDDLNENEADRNLFEAARLREEALQATLNEEIVESAIVTEQDADTY